MKSMDEVIINMQVLRNSNETIQLHSAITICYVGIFAVANGNQQRDKRKNNLNECFLRAKWLKQSGKWYTNVGHRDDIREGNNWLFSSLCVYWAAPHTDNIEFCNKRNNNNDNRRKKTHHFTSLNEASIAIFAVCMHDGVPIRQDIRQCASKQVSFEMREKEE